MSDLSRRFRLPSFALCLALAASGCGGRPHGVLTPQPQAPGTSRVDMLVATTRSAQGAEPGDLFTGERGTGARLRRYRRLHSARCARARSARCNGRAPLPGDPDREFVTLRADPLTRDQAVRASTRASPKTPKRQALVFVHGFNTLLRRGGLSLRADRP